MKVSVMIFYLKLQMFRCWDNSEFEPQIQLSFHQIKQLCGNRLLFYQDSKVIGEDWGRVLI